VVRAAERDARRRTRGTTAADLQPGAARAGPSAGAEATAAAGHYRPDLVNATIDLDRAVQKLAEIRQGRLCLYGPPGTGKSAWAQYLAERLGVPMLQKRASDLLSKWVGDNEKHIAAAFAEAAREGALLLIDEADSLLHDRRKAQQRWQVAQVNELLTQIEIYDGLLVICTNLYEDLDPAALRRFDIRAEFAYLRPEQATALLDECIDRHGIPVDAPSLAAAQQRLQRLDRLTPGDFQTVLRRGRLSPHADVAEFVASLAIEQDAKRDSRNRPIGFHRVARRSRRQRLGASAAVAIAQCTLPSDLVAISSSVARCAAIRSAIRA
jgi:SpoVK/Ycf46/Vps4 family AAA+-type ATPase